MSNSSVLTANQKKFLKLFSLRTSISDRFYLTCGTALSEFYAPYRLSEDLDFFSENEVDTQEILSFIKSIKKALGYSAFDISTSFNRNLIFLELGKKETLKTEFTYFPFPQIEKPKKKNGMLIDSPIDIAVNKLFTIYQKPRSRDFMDFYMLIEKYDFKIADLIKMTRAKFDVNIDYIQLGTQFMEALKLKDYPNLLVELKESKWQNFFMTEAKKFKNKILV